MLAPRRSVGLLLVVGAALVALVASPPAGLAAEDVKPKGNSAFQAKDGTDVPLTFETNKSGRKLINFNYYSDCSRVPFQEGPIVKVKKSGKFSYSGILENVTGEEVEIEISGAFKTPKKGSAVLRYSTRKCSGEPETLKFSRSGEATGSPI